IDNMLKNVANIKGRAGKNLLEYADDIPMNAQLATIVTDLEVGQDWQDLKINTDPCAHIDELRELYSELGFRNELASLDHPNHPANGNGHGTQSVAHSQADAESQAQIAKSLQSSTIGDITDSKIHDRAWHTILDEPAFDNLVQLLASAPHFVIDTETTSVYWRQAELVGL
ncbi:DNA polymerase I, partial [Psychrobacter sp. 16-Bac2893]